MKNSHVVDIDDVCLLRGWKNAEVEKLLKLKIKKKLGKKYEMQNSDVARKKGGRGQRSTNSLFHEAYPEIY